MWTKYPDETILESADWTDILRGDTISGAVSIEPTGDLTCTASVSSTINGVSTIRITGGEAGESGFLVATINTTGAQVLKPQQAIKIVGRPSIVA